MNYLDIVLGILLILSAIHGFSKGFVEELASLVALILGIWIAIHFSDTVGRYLADLFNYSGKHLSVIAFIITFIVVAILVHMVGAIVNKMVKTVHLGFLNRLTGLAFGAVKGALVLSVLLVIINKFDKDVHLLPEHAKTSSRLYIPIKNFAPDVFPFLDFWGENRQKTTK